MLTGDPIGTDAVDAESVITGLTPVTASENVAVLVPPGPVAVIVYVARALVAVAVPEISPVDVLIDKPVGNDGLIE